MGQDVASEIGMEIHDVTTVLSGFQEHQLTVVCRFKLILNLGRGDVRSIVLQ